MKHGDCKKLAPHVADLIAAGEVVERPASAVKELMENAVDAGATQVTVEIRNGGIDLIRVTDNGCGMSREDAQTCFIRHATSKIATEEDLHAILTLGFRGEALAAISAVARVELVTRMEGDGPVRASRSPAARFCPWRTRAARSARRSPWKSFSTIRPRA